MISKNALTELYVKQGKSMQSIATKLGCSLNKIRYWMDRYSLERRSISEAIYLINNPKGDPFKIKYPENIEEAKLFGLGLGLYWGEGTKADKASVRLGNTDPKLICVFIEFLVKTFRIKKADLKFSLQLFNDSDVNESLEFWIKKLKVKRTQFYKTIITRSVSKGTYRKKSKYGVLTIHYHNKKLRDLLVNLLPM